jgi:hypothetical protein
MSSSWPSHDDLVRGIDINHDDIVDFLMESCWTGELQRDYVLGAALRATIGCMASCQVLAKRFSTETDERIASTAEVVRRSEEVSHNTWIALKCWETGDLNNLHATVEACIVACGALKGNLRQYYPEMYPPEMYRVDRDGTISPDTLFDMRKTYNGTLDCQSACETFLKVWSEEEATE